MSLYVAKEDGSIKKIRDKGTFGIYNGSKPITKIYTERKKMVYHTSRMILILKS